MLIVERAPADAELAALLDAAFAELVARYGPDGRSSVHPDARFLVAVIDEVAAGCAAVQPGEGGTSELKRMFVLPGHRGRGVARSLLKALEEFAAGLGYERMRLATGLRQPEAIALYESSGYQLTEPYGRYVGQPLVRCYAKDL
ncbi:GNAT family N-acetyltransferase [Nonomuraea phyllanthi]|uniref:GNAT family N-acetyltransferase n=1 Tax=Nonomuraea phyllanthi TaxID=2219224 RepID=A0A5C4WEM1_9ACTN|nr:GNAT family N-acetyltransferase [Nonomuraea phyllanthi]KAB8193483.1 GNAT family N-acetyltransferase [Nonomuraea phyllanthi]